MHTAFSMHSLYLQQQKQTNNNGALHGETAIAAKGSTCKWINRLFAWCLDIISSKWRKSYGKLRFKNLSWQNVTIPLVCRDLFFSFCTCKTLTYRLIFWLCWRVRVSCSFFRSVSVLWWWHSFTLENSARLCSGWSVQHTVHTDVYMVVSFFLVLFS